MPELTREKFIEKYRPIASMTGDFVSFSFYSKNCARRALCERAADEGRVWTLHDKDGGLVILPGNCAYPVETYITQVALADSESD